MPSQNAVETLDLSNYYQTPMKEIIPVIREHFLFAAGSLLTQLSALVVDRTLELVREAPRDQILQELAELDGLVAWTERHDLRAAQRDVVQSWLAYITLLAEASRRANQSAVLSILASQEGAGCRILKEIYKQTGRMSLAEFRQLAGPHLAAVSRELIVELGCVILCDPEVKGGEITEVELTPGGWSLVRWLSTPRWDDIS